MEEKDGFEWDENKNESNKAKHDISFEEATEAFKDKKGIEQKAKNYGEDRFAFIGKIMNKIIFVVYTKPRKLIKRLISARPASRKERQVYNQNNTN